MADDSFLNYQSLFDPNAFLKGAMAGKALGDIYTQNQANSVYDPNDPTAAVNTLNAGGLYDQGTQAANSQFASQDAATLAAQKQANLNITQQSGQENAYNFAQKQQQDEQAKVGQVADLLKRAQAQGQDPNVAYAGLHDYLTNQLGLSESDYQGIGDHLKNTPGFLDEVYNRSLGQLGNRVYDKNTGQVVINSPTGGANGKPQIIYDKGTGIPYQVITDSDGNAHYQAITAAQAAAMDQSPTGAPAASGQQPATAALNPNFKPVMNGTEAQQALQVAYAEGGANGWKPVLATIINRANKTGASIGDVLRAPYQFETVSNGSAARVGQNQIASMASDPDAQAILQGQIPAAYQGFTNFYSPSGQAAMIAKGSTRQAKPSWDDGTGVNIGGNLFFKSGPVTTQNNPIGLPTNIGQPGQAAQPAAGAPAPFSPVAKSGTSRQAPVDPTAIAGWVDQVQKNGWQGAGVPQGNAYASMRDAIQVAGQQKYGSQWNPGAAGADFKANSTGYNATVKQTDLQQGYEAGTEAAGKLIQQFNDPQSLGLTNLGPGINGVILQAKVAMGDGQAKTFDNYVNAYADEYAKVLSGSTGGAAATDSARSAAHSRIYSAMAGGQLSTVLQGMNNEMRAKLAAQNANIGDIRSRIRSGGSAAAAPTGPAPGAPDLGTIFQQYGIK